MSRPDTIADISGRSTMGSASDVNRSPAIGHARSPGQSADWPHLRSEYDPRRRRVKRKRLGVKRLGVNAKASRVTRRAASRGTLSGAQTGGASLRMSQVNDPPKPSDRVVETCRENDSFKKFEDLRQAGAPSEVSALRKFSPRVARSAVRPSMTAGPEDKSPTSTSRQAKPRPKHR